MKSHKLITSRIVAMATVLVLTGLTHARAFEPGRMLPLGLSLVRLTESVEMAVRLENPPEGTGSDELLSLVTSNDNSLMAPFEEYVVKAMVQDHHAIVLVCTNDGLMGLFEDAGCSMKLDRLLWREEPPQGCEFTLSVSQACSAP